MRRLIVVVLAAVLLVGLAAPAYAGGRNRGGGNTTANVALGLASFAVFNQVVSALTDNHRWHQRTVVYEQPVVYVAPAPVVYERRIYAAPTVIYETAPTVIVASPPPPPPPPQVILYPHGRHEFNGAQWVWIPNAPAPPPIAACQPTGKFVKTPQGGNLGQLAQASVPWRLCTNSIKYRRRHKSRNTFGGSCSGRVCSAPSAAPAGL